MSVVPTVSFDTFFAFDDVLTSDFQGINIQGDISYIIRDYEKVAGMIDFSYTSEAGYEEKKKRSKAGDGKANNKSGKDICLPFFCPVWTAKHLSQRRLTVLRKTRTKSEI